MNIELEYEKDGRLSYVHCDYEISESLATGTQLRAKLELTKGVERVFGVTRYSIELWIGKAFLRTDVLERIERLLDETRSHDDTVAR